MRLAIAVVLACGDMAFGQPSGSSANERAFQEKIAPLRDRNCAKCHGGPSPAGGLSMTGLASVMTGGKHGPALEDYLRVKLGDPMKWESWTYCMFRNGRRLEHTPGAGSIALHSTDAMRFGYLLLHQGKWQAKRPSPYNPHYPYSLMFEVNQGGHVVNAPKDAYWKSGAGGFAIYIVPSLDLVIYKLGGTDVTYAGSLTQLPQPKETDMSRADWKAPRAAEGAGVPGILEMVTAAVTYSRR